MHGLQIPTSPVEKRVLGDFLKALELSSDNLISFCAYVCLILLFVGHNKHL